MLGSVASLVEWYRTIAVGLLRESWQGVYEMFEQLPITLKVFAPFSGSLRSL
jgi:hypothetical protein